MDRLILLRHGEAQAPGPSGDDLDRELTDAGRAAAAAAGRALAGEPVDLALVSAAVRTRQTWAAARAAWAQPPPERVSPALYDLPPAELLRLAEAETVACVLLVGHNPGLHALAADLAGADARLGRGFPPGTAAVLAREGAGWRLARLHRPGDTA